MTNMRTIQLSTKEYTFLFGFIIYRITEMSCLHAKEKEKCETGRFSESLYNPIELVNPAVNVDMDEIC